MTGTMKYTVRHTTSYNYTDAVSVCHNELHLIPRHDERQSCESTELAISPSPAAQTQRSDYFGNRTTFLTIQEPHRRLSITAASHVEVHPPELPEPDSTEPWESLRRRLTASRHPPDLRAYEFVFDSPYVKHSWPLLEYAQSSFTKDRPILSAALDLMRRIHAEFIYDPKATCISTPLHEVLANRRGVCQDFAHLQIGCLRSLGLPARYVSGYLRTTPPPGRPRLTGADASHAWLSLYTGSDGWVDLDPTNGQPARTSHITVALGRDYNDVTPMRGVILGGGSHRVSVSVDVEPLG